MVGFYRSDDGTSLVPIDGTVLLVRDNIIIAWTTEAEFQLFEANTHADALWTLDRIQGDVEIRLALIYDNDPRSIYEKPSIIDLRLDRYDINRYQY